MARPVETIDPKLETSRYITVDGEYEERDSFAGMVYSDSLLQSFFRRTWKRLEDAANAHQDTP